MSGIVGTVKTNASNVLSDIVTPNKWLSGVDIGPGGLLLAAIFMIIMTIAADVGYEFADHTPQWLDHVMNIGGLMLVVGLSFFIGIATTNRWNATRGTDFWDRVMNMAPSRGKRSRVTGAGEWSSFPNHPFYVTGSSEYNETKTVSDNYLPTL